MRTEYAELWISADLARQIVEILDERDDNMVHLHSTRVYEHEEPVEDEVFYEEASFGTYRDDTATVLDSWGPEGH